MPNPDLKIKKSNDEFTPEPLIIPLRWNLRRSHIHFEHEQKGFILFSVIKRNQDFSNTLKTRKYTVENPGNLRWIVIETGSKFMATVIL